MSVLAKPSTPTPRRAVRLRLLAIALPALAAALLGGCGSSGSGLIPLANAGPLQKDFEAVARAAQTGNGDCAKTTAMINKTERDFAALPSTINMALHDRLEQGIKNLRERALELCAQVLTPTNTTTQSTASPTATTPATTAPTATTPQTTPTTTPTAPPQKPPENGGGTIAPGGESGGEDNQGGGGGAAGGAPGGDQEGGGNSESGGARAGGQEAGK